MDLLHGNVLITGGAGTLGRAVMRLANEAGWDCSFTIYSRSELLQAQTRARFPRARYVLGDVRDSARLLSVVAGHDVVIHAAAMKRIPECEAHPTECMATNVLGSANVVQACIALGVRRCVGISTDKACQAVTMYGASKLAMEKLFQAAPAEPCVFSLVRFGNVVASRGSVIPLWRDQAASGRPLTITDRRMTRFWMSESDAARLVVRSLSLPAGAILVPQMGALPVEQMAELVVPGSRMVEVGLRSCEKLHEMLIHPDEPGRPLGLDFLLTPEGETGRSYTSADAPPLSTEQFLAMLAEAEAHE